jgi:RND superfamily putative drug exporter
MLASGVRIMFAAIGRFVNRTWIAVLAFWIGLAVVLQMAAPNWSTVAQDGEFSFLPPDSPSRRADRLFQQAFPQDLLTSSIVIVASRESGAELNHQDKQFITDFLKPRLETIAQGDQGLPKKAAKENETSKSGKAVNEDRPLISRIRAFDAEVVGSLLVSNDRRATLVILELTSDYADRRNRPVIHAIEEALEELRHQGRVPDGLELGLTGSAVVGRDITLASENSAAGTEKWTLILVVALTLVVYRAPLLALIPLATLALCMHISLTALAVLAGAGVVNVFNGIQAYATVVVYASGVDYCLFLISRFKEEMAIEPDNKAALRNAVGKVGTAIAASSLTEIIGIGMLSFASFGKFHQAGIAISFSLLVMLLAVMTLTPALLLLTGRWAFWPYHLSVAATLPVAPGKLPQKQSSGDDRYLALWEKIAEALVRRPGAYWLATVAVMMPFAVVGALWYDYLSFDLVGNLPKKAASVAGTNLLERHFPAGATGPVNVLIRSENVDFSEPQGIGAIQALTESVKQRRDELQVANVRSIAAPLGAIAVKKNAADDDVTRKLMTAAAIRRRAMNYYVGRDADDKQHVTRLELELTIDPFSESAIDWLGSLEAGIRGALPEELQSGTELLLQGSTASLRDLKSVGGSDRNRINVLVVGSVFVILVVLLRRTALTVYLLLTVLFSYLVTLGATFALFYSLGGPQFDGLDWTVPLFLFTVLIAIGEDYNILFVTRVLEEEHQFGLERAVAVALARTGPIISSCGFIMSGTFLSLWLGGQLARMTQLGFALAFGVLLDTFVVRPVLVPTYLILLDRGHLGWLGLSPQARQSGMPHSSERPSLCPAITSSPAPDPAHRV